MSRIGNLPIKIGAGITVELSGNEISVKGPRGQLKRALPAGLEIKVEDDEIRVSRPNEDQRTRSLHGLTRSLINNMVVGVSDGFRKRLEIQGVGYRAEPKGNGVRLVVGFSHPVDYVAPEGIKIGVEGNNNQLVVEGNDKEVVGQVAAELRKVRPPEPYKGKGIRYLGEQVRTKAGKTGAK